MNSYRLGQLQGKGGIFEGKEFKKLWDSKTAYGEEEGTIRNLAIDYIKNVKNGLINAKKQNNPVNIAVKTTPNVDIKTDCTATGLAIPQLVPNPP